MPAATVSQRRTQVHAYLDTMEGHMGLEMNIVACTTHFFTHASPSLSSSFSHPQHTQTNQKKLKASHHTPHHDLDQNPYYLETGNKILQCKTYSSLNELLRRILHHARKQLKDGTKLSTAIMPSSAE
jgi:hypothetical protein